MAYSLDFRLHVLAIRQRDQLSIEQTAERFAVGKASVMRWVKRPERKPSGFRRGKLAIEALAQDVRDYPDAYQYERAARLGVTQNAICYALKHKLGMSYKKTLAHPRADAQARAAFQVRRAEYEAAGRPLVWMDESGFAHDMPRRRDYAPVGQRCYGICDWHAKGRTNVIGALLGSWLIAVGLFQGSINADTVLAWAIQVLLPQRPPNAVLILDNATFHKRADFQNLLRQAGHTLEYLPPYSPDLNPIEHKWAQAKAIRKQTHCSIEDLFRSHQI